MAFTPEQERELNLQMEVENARHANNMIAEVKRTRLELIRLSKEVLIENARNKPTEESAISAADITAFAAQLADYVDA